MSGKSRFSEVRESLIAAVESGTTIGDAARAADVAEATVRGWLREGRRDPESRYAAFAQAIDAARAARPELPEPGLSEADVVALLEQAAKRGSVPAQKALLDRFERQRDNGNREPDEFDQLKASRRGD
jgi:hypothetical protein